MIWTYFILFALTAVVLWAAGAFLLHGKNAAEWQ